MHQVASSLGIALPLARTGMRHLAFHLDDECGW